MDATITYGNPETFADEIYRGYLITYSRGSAIWYVTKENYRRGVGQRRQDAKRWIDLLIEGRVR